MQKIGNSEQQELKERIALNEKKTTAERQRREAKISHLRGHTVPFEPSSKEIRKSPEIQQRAAEIVAEILEKGTVAFYGKLLVNGELRVNKGLAFVGGVPPTYRNGIEAGAFNTYRTRAVAGTRHLDGYNYLQDAMPSVGHVYSRVDLPVKKAKSEQAKSTISVITVPMEEAKREAHDSASLKKIARQEQDPTYILHQFYSGTKNPAGEYMPINMLYTLPQETGEKLEKEFAQNPQLMEAVTELIMQKAGQELKTKQAKDFAFQSEYYEIEEPVQMIKPNISIPGNLISFYEERHQPTSDQGDKIEPMKRPKILEQLGKFSPLGRKEKKAKTAIEEREEILKTVSVKRLEYGAEKIGERSQLRPQRFNHGSLLESADDGNARRREFAEEVLKHIIDGKQGIIIVYGKMSSEGRTAVSEWLTLCTSGLSSIEVAESVFSRTKINKMLPKDNKYWASLEEGSEISTYVESLDEAMTDVPESRFDKLTGETVDLTEYSRAIRKMAGSGNAMFIAHEFAPGTMDRGSTRPESEILYIVPEDVGNDINELIEANPWLMEALSELVLKRAGADLERGKSNDFVFSSGFSGEGKKFKLPDRSISKTVRAINHYRKR